MCIRFRLCMITNNSVQYPLKHCTTIMQNLFDAVGKVRDHERNREGLHFILTVTQQTHAIEKDDTLY